ncbi:MAG TPA: SH3 domain-containing protein, partial [Anaerolineae bacterium]|nr:SH3 domain-containing protein [Anaerolineae bacterium]
CGGKEENETPLEVTPDAPVSVETTEETTEETPKTAVETVEEVAEPAETDPTAPPATGSVASPTMTALVDLNIRSGPGTQYVAVDILAANNQATIIGKSADGKWWKIACPSGAAVECWVSAGTQYSSAVNAENIPVAAAPSAPSAPGSTAVAQITPTSPTTAPPAATTTAPANSTATATAPANTAATATATTPAGNPTAPPPTATTAAPTPTLEPSPTVDAPTSNDDGDSANNPANSFVFNFNQGNVGAISRTHGNAISYPNGDTEDWVELRPQADAGSVMIDMRLTCSDAYANSDQQIRATIWENGAERTDLQARCNGVTIGMPLVGNRTYLIRIHFVGDGPYYSRYSLTLDNARVGN